MVFQAHVLKVLIASPGDTGEERNAVERSIGGWNASRAEREQTVLLPWRWEMHAVPVMGATAQEVINAQAVDQSDIVIALFDSRLGQATDAAVSGTAEEISRAHEAGKPVHVYFSNEPLPRDVDPDQLKRLKDFRAEIEKVALLGQYANPDDLAYQVRQAIEHDLEKLALGAALGPKKRAGAVLRARYWRERIPNGIDNKGRPKYQDKRRLILSNVGEVTAEGVRVKVDEPEGGGAVHWGASDHEKPFDLLPGADREWAFMPIQVLEATIRTTWSEGGQEHQESQTISLLS
ncbi:hypothetical protein [Terracoccus luteus]|uniref:DUF4062 domain-containing protein n=1 Tax=Terracoccus luteus TaxID=53356 RepID=A0A839PWQ7_9MICO|nr:hypothetical protein [Terracoccus luteus]MBB2988520.1 hypothetical protein [Terracoccus luteus]MCP2174169.1 hypothetical protein [Terracoccus luteus]